VSSEPEFKFEPEPWLELGSLSSSNHELDAECRLNSEFKTRLDWSGKEFDFDEGSTDAIDVEVLETAVNTKAADDDEIVSACNVEVETESKRPETSCNIRDEFQRFDISIMQLDQTESSL